MKVRAAYTSQECSACGWVDERNRESQAVFICRACGLSLNADVNAARNVEQRGRAVVPACGDLQPSGGSEMQELAGRREVVPLQPA